MTHLDSILVNCDQNLMYPGYQRFFSRAVGIFGVGRRPTHLRPYKDLTETGNRARKVSGTQGKLACGAAGPRIAYSVV